MNFVEIVCNNLQCWYNKKNESIYSNEEAARYHIYVFCRTCLNHRTEAFGILVRLFL